MSQQQELPLIYEGIDAAPRDEARQIKVGSGRELMFIKFENIALKPLANWRSPAPYQTREEWIDELGIELLADEIYANNGPADPIEGDVERGTGKFFISEGQRRWLAIGYLLEKGRNTYPNGEPVSRVEVMCNPTGFTTADRLKKNYTSQNKMKLKPSQLAAGFKLYKESVLRPDGHQYSNDEIAIHYGVSRQYIDNMLRLNDLDPEMLRKLDYGEITQTEALKSMRTSRPKKEEESNADKSDEGVFVPGGFAAIDGAIKEMEEDDEDEDDDLEDNLDIDDESSLPPAGTTKVETQAAIDAEEESRKTPKKVREQENAERQEAEDAMLAIDFRPDKVEGEFLINESKKNMDKMEHIINCLPDHLKQYKDDLLQLIGWNHTKLDKINEILKKAADTR